MIQSTQLRGTTLSQRCRPRHLVGRAQLVHRLIDGVLGNVPTPKLRDERRLPQPLPLVLRAHDGIGEGDIVDQSDALEPIKFRLNDVGFQLSRLQGLAQLPT